VEEATHIILEVVVLKLAATVKGADEAAYVVSKLTVASISSMKPPR
jgi:hypothetical protein